MKLYDFQCNKCGKEFEDLVKEISDARCPDCESADVTKQLSTFAIGSSSGGRSAPPATGGCGTGFCGTGGCGLN
jgi:putative FmdB family regulatory protein